MEKKFLLTKRSISFQTPFGLLCKFMGHFSIKTNTAKHTGKLLVDIKPVNSRSFAIKNNIQRFGGLFGNFCSQSQGHYPSHRE